MKKQQIPEWIISSSKERELSIEDKKYILKNYVNIVQNASLLIQQ